MCACALVLDKREIALISEHALISDMRQLTCVYDMWTRATRGFDSRAEGCAFICIGM